VLFNFKDEIRQAARILFDYTAACLSDEETNAIVEKWQHHRKATLIWVVYYFTRRPPVPCLQPSADRETMHAALALFLCGHLASEKYSLLSTRFEPPMVFIRATP